MTADLRHHAGADRGNHLCAGANDARPLRILAHHEAVDVVQKDQRDQILIAIHDEAGRLLRALGIDDAADLNAFGAGCRAHGDGLILVGLLIGDNADGVAADARIAAQNGAAEVRLVFVELAAVDEARNHLAHVVDVACAGRGIQQAVDISRRETSARRAAASICGRAKTLRRGQLAARPSFQPASAGARCRDDRWAL